MATKLSFSLLIMLLFLSCKFSPEKETTQASIHFTTDGLKEGIPSGLIHDGKEYHLFYQGKTDTTTIKWEQATSADLIHWNKPAELTFLDSTGNVNSASFVIDWNNTSGLAKEGPRALVAIYQVSSPDQSNSQYLAYFIQVFPRSKLYAKYCELD